MKKTQKFRFGVDLRSRALLALSLLSLLGVARADFSYITLDNPLSSIGAASTQVLGVAGQAVVGSYTDTNQNTYSFTYDGTNYTILDNPDAVNPGTIAVGASTAGGIAGNFTDVNALNYGFVTPDGTNFSTIDPSGVGLTTILGISGTTIFGNTGSNSDAFFTVSSAPSNSTILSNLGADLGSILIAGVASSNNLLFGTYTTNSGSGSFGFITPDGTNNIIVYGPSGNEKGVTSLLGITADSSMVLGTYSESGLGFLAPLDLTNGFSGSSVPVNGPVDASNSVTLIAPAGLSALGSYVTTSGQNAAFLASFQPYSNGISYFSLYGPTNSAGLNNVVGALGSSVVGNYNDTNSNTWGFIALIGNNLAAYVPVLGPTNESVSSLTITNVFSGGISGIFYDGMNSPHNFFSPVTTNNGSIGVDQYVTVDGPPTGTSITALSAVGTIGYYVDTNGFTNNFLFINGNCLPVPSPNSDPSTAATALVGFSTTNAVGTYFDTNAGYTFGFLTPDGVNYTQLLGPAGTNAGILTIDAISGSSIAGTFSDPSSGNTLGYLTLNGGSNYTTIKGPAGTSGGILSVNGVSNTSVVGTYSDSVSGMTYGFINSKAVPGPGGTNTGVLSVNGIAAGNIVGTYADPISGNTYGFIGTGNKTMMGPYGTNGVGINSLDVISGNLIAGTYYDTDNDPNATNSGTSYLYGYLTTDGANYIIVTGPSDSSGGIASIDYLSGSANTVIGTYLDTNYLAHWFAYDGSNYTVIDEPQAQPGGSSDGSAGTTVNGISGTTVFGTYIDNYNLTHGFEAFLLQNQTIAFGSVIAGNTPGTFMLNGKSSSSLPISYSIFSGTNIASISGNQLIFTGAGTVSVVATQAGSSQYNPASPVTNTISIASQGIAFSGVTSPQTFGSPFTVSAISTSKLPVTISVASGPATISGGKVTPTGAGQITLLATQTGNSNYLAATTNVLVSINPASQSISFGPLTPKTYSNNLSFTVNATSDSGLPITYKTTSGTNISINGNIVTILGGGTATITASQAGNANWNAASNTSNAIVINPAAQTISPFAALSAQTYSPNLVIPIPAPASSSGLPVNLSVLSSQGSLDASNNLTVSGAGTIILAANQSGNANYSSAKQVQTSLVVKKAPQTLSAFTGITNIIGDYASVAPFSIASNIPTSSNTNAPVVVSVKSGPATITNNIVTLTGNGVITLLANQAAVPNYLAATPVSVSFSVNLNQQNLSGPISVSDTYYGVPPITVSLPTASSGQPVTLSVVSGPATVKSNKVTLTGVGTVTLAATQAGTKIYGPVQTTTSFNVSQSPQTIAAFSYIAPKSYGAPAFKVTSPTATSGLPVTLSVVSGPATISGNTITINGVGPVTLAADQSGNANYAPAAQVISNFMVNPANQTITFKALSPQSYGNQPFSLTGTASSGLPVSYTNYNTNVASISGGVVTILGAGTTTITATQNGNSNWSMATNVVQTLVVNPVKQVITSSIPSSISKSGGAISLMATASSGQPVTYSKKSGPFTLSGSNNATLTATNTGSAVFYAVQSGGGNYAPVTNTITITIKK